MSTMVTPALFEDAAALVDREIVAIVQSMANNCKRMVEVESGMMVNCQTALITLSLDYAEQFLSWCI